MTLAIARKPEDYRPPTWGKVSDLLKQLKEERQPRIDRIWEVKRARRNQWNDIVDKIPAAYRRLPFVLGESDIPEMLTRITGLVAKSEPMPEVIPPSGRMADVHKASKEEALLHGLRITIQDQQDRDTWAMSVDAQAAWGESWISVWPDTGYFKDPDMVRGKDEKGGDYSKRMAEKMGVRGVPIRFEDHDPQTVFPQWGDKERLLRVLFETEHPYYEIEDVYGYQGKTDADGKVVNWKKRTVGQAQVSNENRNATVTIADQSHDQGIYSNAGAAPNSGKTVKKVVYVDEHCVLTFLDGQRVEKWEHGYGCVPVFYAAGKQTSDRDPAWMTEGVADVALVIARQMVIFSAGLMSSGFMNGFPTPFIRNQTSPMTDPRTGQPISRELKLGQINMLGPGEEIEFPFLNSRMGEDFYRTMDMLSGKLEGVTLGAFNKALGTDIAGYALAQVRSMQMAVLGTLYANARRQWRKIFYFLRHMIRTDFKAGLMLRGAIEETEDGDQYRPILRYGPDDTTDFAIEVQMEEGIIQDEMAERKSALEMVQGGIWSPRRAMERSGVEDPARELEEIANHRMLNSPAADEIKLNLAMQMVTERFAAERQQSTNTPFNQMLQKVKDGMYAAPGQPINQGGQPANALAGGQPIQQNPSPAAPQAGGPTAGPPAGGPGSNQQAMGIPGIPGGVKDAPQVPAGAPG